MSFELTEGDLFALDLQAIGHGVNCKGVMGAGIAARFRADWPLMYAYYKRMCEAKKLQLGACLPWQTGQESPEVVYNLATQYLPGPDANLLAVAVAVQAMVSDCEFRGIKEVGIPQIGCGIGGLEWADVERMVAAIGEATPVRLIVVAWRPGE